MARINLFMEEIKELINLFHLFRTELEMTFLKKDANT